VYAYICCSSFKEKETIHRREKMIKLVGVKKTHINNKRSSIEALKGIDLDLPQKGFILLTGCNGSGKSTLLSVLGGLDTVTSGQVIIDGIDYAPFQQKQLDDWRGKHVAFMFQEYNLLSNYTVAENIRLGKELSGEKITDAELGTLLKKVGLDGFETRYPKDLSGGERQKVAVARALVKNPRIILVDEPTAQADKQSSLALMTILKELSQTCLVVCVAHASAPVQKYADRVIELANGKIQSDTGAGSKPAAGKAKQTGKAIQTAEAAQTTAPSKAFSFAHIAQFGVKNFKSTWGKAMIGIVITMLSLIFFATSIMLSQYDRFKVLARDIHGATYYTFGTEKGVTTDAKAAAELALGKQLSSYIPYNQDGIAGIIETDKDLFGYKIYADDGSGNLLGDGKVVITDYLAMQLAGHGVSAVDLIGTQLALRGQNLTISGIVEVNHQQSAGNLKVRSYKIDAEYALVFVAKGFAKQFAIDEIQSTNFTVDEKTIHTGRIMTPAKAITVDRINGTSVASNTHTFAADEICISYHMWLTLGFAPVNQWPVSTAPTIQLRVANGITQQYKVIGTFGGASNRTFEIMMSNQRFSEQNDSAIIAALFPTTKLLLNADGISEQQLAKTIKTMNKQGFKIESIFAKDVYEFSSKIELFKNVFLAFAVFSLVQAAVFLYQFTTSLITARKKDIGILRSLGARSTTIIGIFAVTIGIITAIGIAGAIVMMFGVAGIANSIATSSLGFTVSIASVTAVSVISVALLCMVVSAVATVFPILKYSKQSPVRQLKR
jgi:ABC-type lipoprotein export system ATPase subunit/ABC-type antimicrobial peptide transport system permease subunit